MRRHFDGDEIRRHAGEADAFAVLAAEAGEHQFLIGVFVIDHEQAVAGRRVGQGEIAKEIVVVAELALLRGGALRQRIKAGRVGEHRIAPADQNVGVVVLRDLVAFAGAGNEFAKFETGVGGLGALRRQQRQRADGGGDRGDAQRA